MGRLWLHDLVLFPFYALLGAVAAGLLLRRGTGSRLRIAVLNHLRFPVLMSGLLLLVWYPLVAGPAERGFMRTTGLSKEVYLGRWLWLTAALFVGSALILALRYRGLSRQSRAATMLRSLACGTWASPSPMRGPDDPALPNVVMDERGSILVVDDEPTITDVVSRYLERAGYSTRIAGDGAQALRLAGESRPDLVVLDLMMPGMDGLEVMRRLREHERVSVILLTAKGEHTDRIIGLRLGADDYVVKPFSPAELVARVDAVLRRVDNSPALEEPIAFDDLELDPLARRVTVRGEEAQLTVREYDLLLHFVRHPGQVFSRDQLMDAVWQYSFYTDTSTVTVHVRRLRAKIEQDPSSPRWLQTVWGVGYRFQP